MVRLQFAKKYLKSACRVLEKSLVDRRDQDSLVLE
uniref:Uncharacterized protein n=1 Tax=Anguilla anguilla TaxID=7936 RepID=A0A0E9TYM8_ANGAN